MLTELRGRPCQVLTGFAVMDVASNHHVGGAEIVDVQMSNYSDEEITHYVRTGEPSHTASIVSINGFGALFVQRIEGDPTAIGGLPARPVASALREYGIRVL